MSILSCQNVGKNYGALAAVSEMSFEVQSGEILGVGGPNGAGKTTLFDLISGITPSSSGKIFLEGQDISRLKPDKICHRGLLRTFQLNAGFDTMTVRENILVSTYYGTKGIVFPALNYDKQTNERADYAMELVGLTEFADRVVADIPVLQRKLLMLAGAIACNPKILLMDEPAGGLSPHEIDTVIELLKSIRKELNLTIVLIEHVMRFFVALSDRVMIMHHGQKIYEGTSGGLLNDKTVVDVYLGEGASERLKHIVELDQSNV